MAEKGLKQFANDIKRHVDEKAAETQRHFDVVAEDLTSTITQILDKRVWRLEKKLQTS